jgi:hypothetical protein
VWTPVARIVARVRRAREETPESKQKFDTELLVSDVLLKLHTAAVIGLLDDESKTDPTTRLLKPTAPEPGRGPARRPWRTSQGTPPRRLPARPSS